MSATVTQSASLAVTYAAKWRNANEYAATLVAR